ncbi:putative homoserine O-acetyltransferase [Burkholderiales bacterium]|nr:putative homoserine O-acetyltransferase [Burkholderiales bacterium]
MSSQASQASATPPLLVEKKTFCVPHFTTQGGRLIKDVRIGYETYGRLNDNGDNAILVCHYFSGSSHCAGKYHPDDPLSGYWDAIIGPGKAIDTDRFFVVSADTLSNVCPKDPMVVTVGPATVDPDTGWPYGAAFPIVTNRDFVRLQKALLDSLGVKRLKCVAGPSMGAMQTFEWGAQYPGMVDRLLPVIGAGLHAEPYFIAEIDMWTLPILMDPNWRGGNYFDGPEPVEGLRQSLKIITLTARAPGWARALFDRSWAKPDADPLAAGGNLYSVESTLDAIVAERSRYADAAHLVHLVRGCRIYDIDEGGSSVKAIRAPTLLISVASDGIMFQSYSRRAADELRAQGTPVQWAEIDTDGGHLDGLYEIARVAPQIRAFLE